MKAHDFYMNELSIGDSVVPLSACTAILGFNFGTVERIFTEFGEIKVEISSKNRTFLNCDPFFLTKNLVAN